MGGFIGKILKVDLTKGKIKEEALKETFYRKWFGTYGLGARVLYDEIPAKTDPLGPDNIIGLTTGVATGTAVSFSGSFTAVGKSPLTGTWGDSRGGGFFGKNQSIYGLTMAKLKLKMLPVSGEKMSIQLKLC